MKNKNKIVHIQIRIENDIRDKFNEKCKNEDITGSQLLRKKIIEFIEEKTDGCK